VIKRPVERQAFCLVIPPEDDPMPEPPARPRPEECCGRGCDPCVYDLYEEALERYEDRLRQWRDRNQ
jgi:oxidoreductase family protein